jgi:hypothetical protein
VADDRCRPDLPEPPPVPPHPQRAAARRLAGRTDHRQPGGRDRSRARSPAGGSVGIALQVELDTRPALINGAAGVVAFDGELPFAVLAFTVLDDRAVTIDVFNDPELVAKLDIRGITA